MPRRPKNLPARRRLYWATWRSGCVPNLRLAGYDRDEIEQERHACHRRCLGGHDPSSNVIIASNDLLDAVLAEFKVIAAPDDLDAQLAHINQDDARQRLVSSIRGLGLDDPYFDKIARDTFKLNPWTALPLIALTKLRFTATTRARQRRKQAPPAPSTDPF